MKLFVLNAAIVGRAIDGSMREATREVLRFWLVSRAVF
jgi:hypothetical protein